METLTSLFAFSSLETLGFLANVLKVALGLGFVIFIHELGHFLLAKWNGVKVEKFSIGFGPALLGFRRGETEYVVSAFPLGGFVKMLGEGEGEAQKTTDPRAFPNKPVGARMAIISAGVVMNLAFGLVCFVYAYGQGRDEIPAQVGMVVAGSPAYEAGLRPGDEIVALDGRRDISFTTLRFKVSLSGAGQLIHFEVKRPGHEGLIHLDIEPRRDASAEMPSIGIAPASSLILGKPPFEPLAGLAGPHAPTPDLRSGDRLIAVGPDGRSREPVATMEDLRKLLARYRKQLLQFEFERHDSAAAGRDAPPRHVTVTLPPNHFVDFGVRLPIEPVAALTKGGPAEQAGFRKGDRIIKVDGREDFDPMRLPDECYVHGGSPMTFEVERPEPGGKPAQVVTLSATPDASPPWTDFFPAEGKPMDVPGLGLAYFVSTKILAIAPGSPAAQAGLKVGDTITSMRLFLRPHEGSKKSEEKSMSFTFDAKNPAWVSAFALLQFEYVPGQAVELAVNGSKDTLRVSPVPDSLWIHPLRGLQFRPLTRHVRAQSITVALQKGFDETVEKVLSIYAMFRSLWQQRVSPRNLGGPIMIATVAYDAAGQGLTDLIYFLGFLSINLAVLNFLPIPPLDGGQMVFLIAEKVRGRPLPDAVLNLGLYLGLFLVLGLMVFVIFQDVFRLVTG